MWVCRGEVYKHRLCTFHYHQKTLLRQACVKRDCSKPLFLNLLCRRHFYLEYGRCLVPLCNEKAYCSNRCRKHYRSNTKVKSLKCKLCLRKAFVNDVCAVHILPRACKVNNCNRKIRAKGLCCAHYFSERRKERKEKHEGTPSNSNFSTRSGCIRRAPLTNVDALALNKGNDAGSDDANADEID